MYHFIVLEEKKNPSIRIFLSVLLWPVPDVQELQIPSKKGIGLI